MIKIIESNNEIVYDLSIPIEIDKNIDSSYEDTDVNMFSKEVDETINSTCESLFNLIDNNIMSNIDNILEDTNLLKLELEYSDHDDSFIYAYIITNKAIDADTLADKISPYCSMSTNEYTGELEFDGNFIGYASGSNYPDAGGPPEYSSETMDVEIIVTSDNDITIEIKE